MMCAMQLKYIIWPLYSGFFVIIIKNEGEFVEEFRNKIKTSINTYKIVTGVEGISI
jgi:hypothetical protein